MSEMNLAIWAVDAFAKNKKLQMQVLQTLAKAIQGTGTKIEPVCVLSPDNLKIPAAAFQGQSKDYRLAAEKILHQWMQTLRIPNVETPTLLVQESFSLGSSVDTLLKHAKSKGAELIACGTTTKTGATRLLVGSYAETLAMRSPIPVLVVGPSAKTAAPPKKFLFATDYSDKSRQAFNQILPLAKVRKATILLYYKVEYAVPPAIYGFDPLPVYQEYWKQEVAQKKVLAKSWVELAKNAGVKAVAHFDEKSGFVAESVIKAAKKEGCGVIAVASESGAVAAALLGSVSRQVLRLSPLPVWILHT